MINLRKYPTCPINNRCGFSNPTKTQIESLVGGLGLRGVDPAEVLKALHPTHAGGGNQSGGAIGPATRRAVATALTLVIAGGAVALTAGTIRYGLIISGVIQPLCGTGMMERMAHDFIAAKIGGVNSCDQKAALWRQQLMNLYTMCVAGGVTVGYAKGNFWAAVDAVDAILAENLSSGEQGKIGPATKAHAKSSSKFITADSSGHSKKKTASSSSGSSSSGSSSKGSAKGAAAAKSKKAAPAKSKKAAPAKSKKAAPAKAKKTRRGRSRSRSRSRGRAVGDAFGALMNAPGATPAFKFDEMAQELKRLPRKRRSASKKRTASKKRSASKSPSKKKRSASKKRTASKKRSASKSPSKKKSKSASGSA